MYFQNKEKKIVKSIGLYSIYTFVINPFYFFVLDVTKPTQLVEGLLYLSQVYIHNNKKSMIH